MQYICCVGRHAVFRFQDVLICAIATFIRSPEAQIPEYLRRQD